MHILTYTTAPTPTTTTATTTIIIINYCRCCCCYYYYYYYNYRYFCLTAHLTVNFWELLEQQLDAGCPASGVKALMTSEYVHFINFYV